MISMETFVRRQNPDSTVDSICTLCYQTVAKVRHECDLISAEENHVCEYVILSLLGYNEQFTGTH